MIISLVRNDMDLDEHERLSNILYTWTHYPKAQLKSVASNALAARLVKDEPNAAAIASEVALGLYGRIKHINRCPNHTIRRIFNWHNAIICIAFFYFMENFINTTTI
jgi:hypothetical protein